MSCIRTSRHRRGFTLIELLIAMGMLGLLLVIIFSTFSFGTRVFQDSSVRQSAENQLRSIKVLMQRDIKLSNFWFNNNVVRATLDGPRDALALSSLSNWKDDAMYDGATGRPLWDRYIVWYATNGTSGSLYRQVVSPNGAPFERAYGNLGANLSDLNPSSNANVDYSRKLSESVKDFQVSLRLQNGTVTTRIKLLARGGLRPNSTERTEEHLEVTLVFRPKNTWPAI